MAFDRDNEEKLPRVYPTIVNRQFLQCESCDNELQLDSDLDFVTDVRQQGWRQRWSGHSEKDGVKLMEQWSGIFIICDECARGNTNIDWGEKYCHNCHQPSNQYYCDACIGSAAAPTLQATGDAIIALDALGIKEEE